MKPKEIDKIKVLASKFRISIENCHPMDLPIGLREFPRGACGDTALLLAKYLQIHGYDGFDYVAGKWGEQSHAWLEKEDLIVDITADQFDDSFPALIVTKDRSWHSHFRIENRHHSDFEKYDPRTAQTLKEAYNQIVEGKHAIE